MNKHFKKWYFFAMACCLVGFVSFAVGLKTEQSEPRHNGLMLANIEALMSSEDDPEKDDYSIEDCTECISTANCYNKDNMWCNIRITSVRSYKRYSLVEVCKHDRVTSCYSGCSEKSYSSL